MLLQVIMQMHLLLTTTSNKAIVCRIEGTFTKRKAKKKP